MKKRRIFKRVFAILSVVLLMSIFAINTFAYSPPVPDDNHYSFNSENVLSYNKFGSMDNLLDGGTTIVTSSLTGYVAYYAPNQPEQVVSRFDEPIVLEDGHTYYIIWVVISAQADFQGEFFRVYDGQNVFGRDYGHSTYQRRVSGLSVNGLPYGNAFYNRLVIPEGSGDKTIYSLACNYYADMTAPIVFLPFIVQLDDNTAFYIDPYSTLVFGNYANYTVGKMELTVSQLKHFVTLQNSTVYNYQEGYLKGYDEAIADKELYGQQQYATGKNVGKEEERANQISNLAQAKQEGYDIGYQDGVNSGGLNLSFSNMILTVLESPFRVAQKMFDFQFLGVNLANFFFSLLTLIVFVKVITLKS